ncbi:hypothetical protein GCM10023196_106900 [Actinoallomurus vinaceus]|uniref:Fumarate lyase N-terminal domain-containing protein n=1 Tax=Actinoallomurus vinaceus TaxID=1080074 RepID=A0ABP8UUR9_9ACTN
MVGLFRVERDHLGELHVPAHAYYGVHTARAMTNFAVTGEPIAAWPELVSALAAVKAAAAQANHALGVLPGAKADAIVAACTEIRNGLLHEHFVVDLIQGGAGTSTNMNANEVICNRALELLGYPRGEYRFLDPIEDVNRSQSTNDVYPTAVRLAAFASTTALLQSVAELRHRLAEKAAAFAGVVKLGRTQLQDAVPMSLGQELRGYASSIEDTERRLQAAAAGLLEIGPRARGRRRGERRRGALGGTIPAGAGPTPPCPAGT